MKGRALSALRTIYRGLRDRPDNGHDPVRGSAGGIRRGAAPGGHAPSAMAGCSFTRSRTATGSAASSGRARSAGPRLALDLANAV